MTTPATPTSSAADAAAGSPALGPDPARTTTAAAPAGDTAAAVDSAVEEAAGPVPSVAVYEDQDGRRHYASPVSKATRARVAAGEWSEVDGSAAPFDPAKKRVREVIAHLEEHAGDPAEVQRVKDAEAAGENRATIRDWSPAEQ